jgi:hypothetical protein
LMLGFFLKMFDFGERMNHLTLFHLPFCHHSLPDRIFIESFSIQLAPF